MKLGYLGPEGTFSQLSALNYRKGNQKIELLAFPSIQEVLLAVENGIVEEGIVPFENSIEGTVNITIDYLIFGGSLFIKAEQVLPVNQALFVKKENAEKEIKEIYSHPQGLAQCRQYLRTHYPNAELVSCRSTAESAKIVSESNKVVAGIGLKQAGELYGLEILADNIQDDTTNETRFVIVTKQEPIIQKDCIKTSIVFSTENKPGELYRVLDILSIWDLNMTKIESRPMKNHLGTYIFFVDLETKKHKDMEDALKMIERKATFYKYLGSYPVFL